MPRVEYLPIQCKTALNRVQGMPFKWSVNPYSGCSHACHYCYARAYYVRADHGDAGNDFETRILVKTNLRTFWPVSCDALLGGEQIALGTATDVYQPAEGRFRLTRRVLEVLRDVVNPLGLVTKSPLVLRDVDLLADLARLTRVRVFFTITTVDLQLWRTIEPGTANPFKRLQVLRALRNAGVPAGVLLAPIFPGITDSVESIAAVAAAAAEHGAAYFGASALRLEPIVKEHYFDFVEQSFPALLPRYERAYPGVHAPGDYQTQLTARVDRIRAQHGFASESMRQPIVTPEPTRGSAKADHPSTQLPLPLT